MIELAGVTGPVLINVANVAYVRPSRTYEGTRLVFVGGETADVTTNYEEVRSLIRKTKAETND